MSQGSDASRHDAYFQEMAGRLPFPLAEVLDGYGEIAQARWSAWRSKQTPEDRTPESFDDLLGDFLAFVDPILTGAATGTWSAGSRTWE